MLPSQILHKTDQLNVIIILRVYLTQSISFLRLAAQTSGTTVTFVIIERFVVSVASVGDSRCVLESAEGQIYYLSADHRLDCNEEE